MDFAISSYLPLGAIESLNAMPYGGMLVPLALAMLAMVIVGFSIPGALTPTAFLSGAMIGIPGILVVALGALGGTALLYVFSKQFLGAYMTRKFGPRIDHYHDHLMQKGPWYLVGLRIGGVPNLLVTASCVATPIPARTFAAASLLGMLPAITLAVFAGNAII